MQIAIVGAQDFTLRPLGKSEGKYPEAQAAAEEFIRGFIESLPRYAIIVSGGMPSGVEAWVRKYFDLYKDKKRMKMIEHPPVHDKGKPYYDINVAQRNQFIVRDAKDGLFVVIPEEGTIDPYVAEVIRAAQMAHIGHDVLRLTPKGDLAGHTSISGAETFDKEKAIELPRSKTDSKSNSDRSDKTVRRPSKSRNTGIISLKRRRALQTPVPVPTRVARGKRRSPIISRRRHGISQAPGKGRAGSNGKLQKRAVGPIVLKKKIKK